ncbi:MAG TPA: hypothetical protein VKH20_05225 [Solirubrobacterales bacterium]|nr:hypothetical protein [Solirubrobacterales bacterium]
MEQPGRLQHIGRAIGCAFAVAATLSLLAAPGAVARPGDEVRPRSLHLTMAAPGTRGYAIEVDTLGHHRVTLTVSRNGELASYATRGEVSRHRVKADFGRFGKVSLRFRGKHRPFPRPPHRRSKPRTRRTVCRGRRPQREVGRFHGTIEFDGQHGYTRLAVGKLHGEVHRSYRQVCRKLPVRKRKHRPAGRRQAVASSTPTDPFGFDLTLLSVRSSAAGALTRFTAITLEAPRGLPIARRDLFSVITASLQERVGRVRVFRSAFQMAAPGRVRVSRRGAEPQTARLALAPPFSGRANYRSGGSGSPASWTGSLGVRLLGSGLLPLTGPGFHAVLCRVSAFNPRQSCLHRAEARAARASNTLRR